MHVQMFTQQHLRMQGKIDTIVLRTVERAGHDEARDGAAMGYSWGVGVDPGRAEDAPAVHAVADVREIRPHAAW